MAGLVDADVLSRAAANCGGAYRAWAEFLGRPTARWPDVSCGDLGLGTNLPPNNATLLAPPDPGGFGALLERVGAFFAANPGGGYQVWSIWPTPDLRAA